MFNQGRHLLFIAIPVLILGSLLPQAAAGVTLESAYSSAAPQDGYDKFVVLTAGTVYTGGLTIPTGDSACIKGNGALIDLQGGMIYVGGNTTHLDIDHCVVMNGGNPAYGPGQAALNFVASHGNVIGNTIYKNTVGVRVYLAPAGSVTVKNNILSDNTQAGVICELGCEANITYNDGWNNLRYGTYAIDYYCVNGGIQSWTPSPGTGDISANPLYVNAAALDFHLSAGSPCIGAGDPAGTDMGAFGAGGGGGGGGELYAYKTYYPTGATMLTGAVGGGSYVSLAADDASYFKVNAGKSGKKFYTDWYCTTTIDEVPVELTIKYNGKYSVSRSQTLYLYDFTANSWSPVTSSTVGTTEATKIYTTAPGGYVSMTGEIRVRVAASANNKTYACSADFISFTIKYETTSMLAFGRGVEGQTFDESSSDQAELAPAPPAVETGLEAWPNPFNPTVRIGFELERPTTGLLSVYDVSGRKLVELSRGTLEAGPHVVVWDGRDAEGRQLSSGTYIAKLDGDGISQSIKLVMLK